MANYVITDVVQHVYKKDHYRPTRTVSRSLRKIAGKLWLFLIIVGLSAGLGYLAVYLPDRAGSAPAAGTGEVSRMRERFNRLSEEQKRALKERFKDMAK